MLETKGKQKNHRRKIRNGVIFYPFSSCPRDVHKFSSLACLVSIFVTLFLFVQLQHQLDQRYNFFIATLQILIGTSEWKKRISGIHLRVILCF